MLNGADFVFQRSGHACIQEYWRHLARSDLFMVLIISCYINFIDVRHVYTLASFSYQHRVRTQKDHCNSTQRNLQSHNLALQNMWVVSTKKNTSFSKTAEWQDKRSFRYESWTLRPEPNLVYCYSHLTTAPTSINSFQLQTWRERIRRPAQIRRFYLSIDMPTLQRIIDTQVYPRDEREDPTNL